MREWEKEMQPILRKDIRRVVANPVDIARYLVEFYNLARSVKKANRSGGEKSGLSSFEQLVELGRGNRQFDANDQHIVHIVDWLWQYAFEQRASDIHLEPRRDVGIVRFRIDGVLHQVYQIPMEPPTSRQRRTLTPLRRTGRRRISSRPPWRAVPWRVASISSSSAAPSRAKRRSRRRASWRFRLSSSA